jgi:glutamate N-acetyltransferase/amino-acid N-acetyltransferase
MPGRSAKPGAIGALLEVPGGITAVKGVKAAGVACGIKAGRLDLALITSDRPAPVAGVFTRNRVRAAPVILCERLLRGGRLSAIVANSGNANACTGKAGLADAEHVGRWVAEAVRRPAGQVFVCSTGVIGQRLPLEKIRRGVRQAAQALSAEGGRNAALAIMTTDHRPKERAVAFLLDGVRVTVGGMAKGAGMICPDLATTLCFMATDATVEAPHLQRALREAAEQSFNRITVDGDTSTNDTMLCFATGMAGGRRLTARGAAWGRFQEALNRVALELAQLVVRDGEGATKFVEVRVKGARSPADAQAVARAVANSSLVKTMLYGQDCNWGRVFAAAGRSGAALVPERLALNLGGVPVARNGVGLGPLAEQQANERLREAEILLELDLGIGRAESVMWTTDLTEEYVKENAAYRS